MQGNPQVLDALNRALTIELTAINQYFCQAKMCQNWGFWKLGNKHYEESMGEMKHAERLIDRILFLDGVPEIARYDVIRVGADVKEQLENDLALELSGVKHYNKAIDLCMKVKDNGTREILGTGELVGPGGYVYEPAGTVDGWGAVGDEPCVVHIKVTGTIEYVDDDGRVIESVNADTQRAVYLAWCQDHDVRPSGQILG